MKPKEKKCEIVYRILARDGETPQGAYSRACCDEYDFKSVEEARGANYYGIFQDKKKYKISKYRITYEMIEDDCK